MELGRHVTMSNDCRLLTPRIWLSADSVEPVLSIDDNVSLGRGCTISAANRIVIAKNVLFGPNVVVTDHNHTYRDVALPIREQGWSRDGYVIIEKNCWIGANAVIIGDKGVTIGQGSVIGANSVVGNSVPKYSVVVGNPGRIVKYYDDKSMKWVTT
jgi:acetyltransferase-like isoleucine patch superfamily enzyme